MNFYKPPIKFGSLKERAGKVFRTLMRCFILSLVPMVMSAIMTGFWYVVLFQQDIHFHPSSEGIMTAAWITSFALLYCFVTDWAFHKAREKYQAMRDAVKEFRFDVFMNLKDEELSPLVHFLVLTFSINLIGSFMGLHYAEFSTGFAVVWSTTFLVSLVYVVIIEIDGPCSGLWFIKNIPETWLLMDPKVWRAAQWKIRHAHLIATDPLYKELHEWAKAKLQGIVLSYEAIEVRHEETAAKS